MGTSRSSADDPRLIVGGGCSGHAFKHTSGIGEIIAQIACGERPFIDVDFVDPNRFLRNSDRAPAYRPRYIASRA
jgi:sarcosine oxidase